MQFKKHKLLLGLTAISIPLTVGVAISCTKISTENSELANIITNLKNTNSVNPESKYNTTTLFKAGVEEAKSQNSLSNFFSTNVENVKTILAITTVTDAVLVESKETETSLTYNITLQLDSSKEEFEYTVTGFTTEKAEAQIGDQEAINLVVSSLVIPSDSSVYPSDYNLTLENYQSLIPNLKENLTKYEVELSSIKLSDQNDKTGSLKVSLVLKKNEITMNVLREVTGFKIKAEETIDNPGDPKDDTPSTNPADPADTKPSTPSTDTPSNPSTTPEVTNQDLIDNLKTDWNTAVALSSNTTNETYNETYPSTIKFFSRQELKTNFANLSNLIEQHNGVILDIIVSEQNNPQGTIKLTLTVKINSLSTDLEVTIGGYKTLSDEEKHFILFAIDFKNEVSNIVNKRGGLKVDAKSNVFPTSIKSISADELKSWFPTLATIIDKYNFDFNIGVTKSDDALGTIETHLNFYRGEPNTDSHFDLTLSGFLTNNVAVENAKLALSNKNFATDNMKNTYPSDAGLTADLTSLEDISSEFKNVMSELNVELKNISFSNDDQTGLSTISAKITSGNVSNQVKFVFNNFKASNATYNTNYIYAQKTARYLDGASGVTRQTNSLAKTYASFEALKNDIDLTNGEYPNVNYEVTITGQTVDLKRGTVRVGLKITVGEDSKSSASVESSILVSGFETPLQQLTNKFSNVTLKSDLVDNQEKFKTLWDALNSDTKDIVSITNILLDQTNMVAVTQAEFDAYAVSSLGLHIGLVEGDTAGIRNTLSINFTLYDKTDADFRQDVSINLKGYKGVESYAWQITPFLQPTSKLSGTVRSGSVVVDYYTNRTEFLNYLTYASHTFNKDGNAWNALAQNLADKVNLLTISEKDNADNGKLWLSNSLVRGVAFYPLESQGIFDAKNKITFYQESNPVKSTEFRRDFLMAGMNASSVKYTAESGEVLSVNDSKTGKFTDSEQFKNAVMLLLTQIKSTTTY